MPKIVIWMPLDENHPGHVAIATNAYYVSFWPARCLEKDGKNFRTISDAAVFVLDMHKGRLVFNQDFDKEYEGGCDPDYEHEIDAAKVSDEDLNAVIEEFLRYNEIDPEDVTLARGEKKYRRYKRLSALMTPEEAERIIEDYWKPVKSLAKTKYSIVTELVSSKKDNDSAPFYSSHQSCVSFAFNLIQMAKLKLHPDPIPVVNYEEAKNAKEIPMSYFATVSASSLLTGKIPKELAYKVPWFEKEVVRRYLITGCKVNNQPIISGQPEREKVIRELKSFFFSTFILLLLGYFFPETRYPNLFILLYFVGEMEVNDPSLLDYFILPLFIILFAHNFSCGVVLSVVIYYVGDFSYDIMKSYLSGEFGGSRNRFWVEILSVVKRLFEEFDEHARVVIGREPKSRDERLKICIDFFRRAYTK